MRTAEGKLHLIVAIDRTSKFAFVELHEKVTRKTAADFVPTDFRAKHSCCFGCRARFAVLRVDEEVETQQLMKRIVRGWQIES